MHQPITSSAEAAPAAAAIFASGPAGPSAGGRERGGRGERAPGTRHPRALKVKGAEGRGKRLPRRSDTPASPGDRAGKGQAGRTA